MVKFLLLLLSLISFLVPALSMAETVHPIDKFHSDCLANKENITTAGMTSCTNQASKKWEEEISTIYKKLQAHLNPDAKTTLINSQEAWLSYREQEYKTIAVIYKNVQGTMYIPMRAMNILLINKNRAIALNSYANGI